MNKLAWVLLLVLGLGPAVAAYLERSLGVRISGPEVLGGIGTLIAIPGAWSFAGGFFSRWWRKVRGFMVESTAAGGSGYRTRGWYPKVSYRYSVEGREYVGSRISFGKAGHLRMRDAYKEIEGYAAGSEVDIYVNPRVPALSVLKPGIHAMAVFYLMAGLALLALAFVLDLPT